MKYIDLIQNNQKLASKVSGQEYKILILSNIVVDQMKEVLEFHLRLEGINVKVIFGDYDNIVQNSKNINQIDSVIIFFELLNLTDNIQESSFLMTPKELSSLGEKTKKEIALVFQNLGNVPTVIINSFSSLANDSKTFSSTPLELLANDLNSYLNNYIIDRSIDNIVIADLNKVMSSISVESSVDMRQYYSSKALYTFSFFNSYIEFIKPNYMEVLGRIKKVLVLDCDNTLWGGVIGEDGVDGIRIGSDVVTGSGNIFARVQNLILSMKNQGVLLALCSKNNMNDVELVFNSNPGMVLKNKDFVCKKINWQDKASNIREISIELNLGLDSFIFIDDSDFEIGLVEKKLPQVTCFSVPKNLSNYTGLVRDIKKYFFKSKSGVEDLSRTDLYHVERKRSEFKNEFTSLDEYLKSLNIIISVSWNSEIDINRAAQMSQKTNQFNLATVRYTAVKIQEMIQSTMFDLMTFSLKDDYGEYGISGLIVISRQDDHQASIDNFLMSCRVLGRSIEYKIINYVLKSLHNDGIRKIIAKYVVTNKNQQVEGFFEKVGFSIIERSKNEKNYFIDLGSHVYNDIEYIKIK
jgi:FkbH-like protein